MPIQLCEFSQPQPLVWFWQVGYRLPYQLHWQAPFPPLELEELLEEELLDEELDELLEELLEEELFEPDGATARPVDASIRPAHRPRERKPEAI